MDIDLLKKLQAPFKADEVEWRVDRGQHTTNGDYVFILVYVTNRAIMDRLDEVFDIGGWKNEFKEWRDKSQICGISCKINDEWITKWDGSDDSNMDAVKGGLSGAMKRAAVQWGIGRYLYKLDQTRAKLNEKGENYANVKVKVQGKEEYIKGYWDTPKLPAWALPISSGNKTPIPTETPPQQPTATPQSQQPSEPPKETAKWIMSDAQRGRMYALIKEKLYTPVDLKKWLVDDFKIISGSSKDLTKIQYDMLCTSIEKMNKKEVE